MNFLKNNFLIILPIAGLVSIAFTDPASAQIDGGTNGTIMEITKNKASTTFQNVKSIVFIVGGFGLVL